MPISGISPRAFVEQWGEGVKLGDVLTLANFQQVFDQLDQVRAIINTFLIGTLGGTLAVACHTAISLAGHRQRGGVARALDYLVLIPRAIPAADAVHCGVHGQQQSPAWHDRRSRGRAGAVRG